MSRTYDALKDLQDEVEECIQCCEEELCKNHFMKREEIRSRQAALADPQKNRIGVEGDPTPDSEYGDRL